MNDYTLTVIFIIGLLPRTYQYYRNWSKFTLEAVRICIIQSRQNKITRVKDFDKILNDHDLRSI